MTSVTFVTSVTVVPDVVVAGVCDVVHTVVGVVRSVVVHVLT